MSLAVHSGQEEQEPPAGDDVDDTDGEKPEYPWAWAGQAGETENGLDWQSELGWCELGWCHAE